MPSAKTRDDKPIDKRDDGASPVGRSPPGGSKSATTGTGDKPGSNKKSSDRKR